MSPYRRSPRAVALPLDRIRDELAPQTLLADAQRVWPDAVGKKSCDGYTLLVCAIFPLERFLLYFKFGVFDAPPIGGKQLESDISPRSIR